MLNNSVLINILANFFSIFVLFFRSIYFFEDVRKISLCTLIFIAAIVFSTVSLKYPNWKYPSRLISAVVSAAIIIVVTLLVISNNSRTVEIAWVIILLFQLVAYAVTFFPENKQ